MHIKINTDQNTIPYRRFTILIFFNLKQQHNINTFSGSFHSIPGEGRVPGDARAGQLAVDLML
jgi:hypothetical protein